MTLTFSWRIVLHFKNKSVQELEDNVFVSLVM